MPEPDITGGVPFNIPNSTITSSVSTTPPTPAIFHRVEISTRTVDEQALAKIRELDAYLASRCGGLWTEEMCATASKMLDELRELL